MSKHQQEADSRPGYQIIDALREEAKMFENDGKVTAARRMRALADRMASYRKMYGCAPAEPVVQ